MTSKHQTGSLSAFTWAWLTLVGMTAVGWWFGLSARNCERGATVLLGVIAAACIKVWIIGYQFMELRVAPAWLRYGFLAWVTGIGVVLTAICL
ncbi:MAG: cytochrome C oxidase subunit IV family protein [Proteobacteria bacterium]|nr:cytochrome C oxidase subunit IV family protein [Pseudomonadota bacterium]